MHLPFFIPSEADLSRRAAEEFAVLRAYPGNPESMRK